MRISNCECRSLKRMPNGEVHWDVVGPGSEFIKCAECKKSDADEALHAETAALRAERDALAAKVKELEGLRPEFPPRPPNGMGAPRYGLRWPSHGAPLAVPMPNGYWTPWHLAEAALAAEQAAHAATRDSLFAHLEASRAKCDVHHGARTECGQCHDSLRATHAETKALLEQWKQRAVEAAQAGLADVVARQAAEAHVARLTAALERITALTERHVTAHEIARAALAAPAGEAKHTDECEQRIRAICSCFRSGR